MNTNDAMQKLLTKLLTEEEMTSDVVAGSGIPMTGGGGEASGDVTIVSPTVFPVSDNGGSLTVDGSVSVSNFPAVQPINDNGGSLTVDGSVTASVSNFPSTYPVTDNGGSLTVDGTVAVSNFPATQPVSGSVSVSNFPATQPVSGTVTVTDGSGSLTVDGTVSVSNFPGTQAVSGTVTANAGSGTFTVGDGGSSLTVDGTVTANAGTGTFTTKEAVPTAANILSGSATLTNSITEVTIITIPANRTWYGSLAVSGGWTSTTAAATLTTVDIKTAGTGVTPAAGTRLLSIAVIGAQAAAVASTINNVYVAAPVGNSVTIVLDNSQATTFTSSASATGVLL